MRSRLTQSMKYLSTLFFVILSSMLLAQSPVGIWQTIDDNEGDVRTEVELYYTTDSTIEAKVHHLFRPDAPLTCPRCPGNKKDQLLIGLIFMWNLEYDNRDERWEGGRILEPESGREFKCYLQMNDDDHIKVRGYIGFPAIGRTQNWYRKGSLTLK